jgi:SAM-dependent methyltransferase
VTPTIDGYVVHAPELALASEGGFEHAEFDLLYSREARNFWFRGRNRLIVAALRRHCRAARRMLEIGCGTGFVLQGIGQAFPQLELAGSEIALAGLAFAKRRIPRAALFQMDARNIPYANEFDVIGAFDVLEHIEDDASAITAIFGALRPGGHAIFSVPQHMFLWSEQDRRARHFRRYGTRHLERALREAGFRIEMRTSFVTLLLPALYAARHARAENFGAASPELNLPAAVDRIFGWTLDLERRMIDLGIRLPTGGSQLIVASKPE